ncbi:MAG: hypothetical protein OEW68_17890, partial [Gammaproteobacteria bacterium]|nr:hypothetical protein [Gammaproteobacteria bacterium]
SKLTLADVNRVIRENLDADSIQYVFVAKDAQDLHDRLASDRPSTVTYEAEKPADLLQEDKVIEKLPLGIPADAVRVIKADEVFGRGT